MANEGLGSTAVIVNDVDPTTSYGTPFVLTPKGANRLVVTFQVTAGTDATSIEMQVRSRRDGTGTFIARQADLSFPLGAESDAAANRGNFRTVIDNITRDERDMDIAFKSTGGGAATRMTAQVRFNRQATPLAT